MELVVHDGLGYAVATIQGEEEFVDWAFTIWNPRTFHRLHSSPISSHSSDAPLFRMPLPPPRIDVYVSKEGRINWDDVKIPPGIHVVDERAEAAGITPVDGGVVVGSVYSIGTGKPIKGSVVFLEPTAGNETATTTLSAACDDDGAFMFERIPKGTYKVIVWADGYAALQASSYYTNHELTYRKFVMYLADSVKLTGRVVDPEGNPAVGAEVRVRGTRAIDGRGYRLADSPEPAVTDENGRFEFAGLPEGYLGLWCLGAWYSKNIYETYAAPADDMCIEAVQTGTIRGRLVDSDGKPLAERVHVVPKGNPIGRWHDSAMADKNGAFEMPHLPPDTYLIAGWKEPTPDQEDSGGQTVDLGPGVTVELTVVANK
jgi:hypothetical protein